MHEGAAQRGSEDRPARGESAGRAGRKRAEDSAAADDAEPVRRETRRELLARLRRAAKSGSSAGAGVGGVGVPLHTMLLAICAAGEVRKEMLFALAERPRDVGTLARDMDLDQPRVSQHLSQLRKAGLVSSLCEGGRKVYSVPPHPTPPHPTGGRRPGSRAALPKACLGDDVAGGIGGGGRAGLESGREWNLGIGQVSFYPLSPRHDGVS
ncbi:MAG: transcriptional regulator [Phycisphaeraceae bacterium]|nr:transcriptional regulator [Phycisphaeraceae bacterium]